MILAIIIFAFLSIILLCPGYRWMLIGTMKLSRKEEKIGVLFGRYLGLGAILLLLLWLLQFTQIPYLYLGSGSLFLLLTVWLFVNMVRLLNKG